MAKIIVNKKNIDIIINAKKIFPTLENLEITPRDFEQKFNHPNSYGYDKVTVKAMEINLQDKETIPTKETQEITADNNYNGLSKVTVNNIIPDGSVDIIANGIYDVTSKATANVNIPMPTGTIEITENGTHNVKDKEFANVNVQPVLQEKTVTITENGTTITQNDSEYDGLSKVTTIVNVPKPELGEKTISTNGTYNSSDDSLDGYSKVIVNVPEKQLGTKTITSNGLYKATDDNLDGYSEVNVETSGVDINNYFVTSPTITKENYLMNKLIKNIPMIDTSNVIKMNQMFYYYSSLENPNIRLSLSKRNTSSSHDISYSDVDISEVFNYNFINYSNDFQPKNEFQKLIIISPESENNLELPINNSLKTGTYKLEFELYDGNHLVDKDIKYIGSQLAPHWIYKNFKIQGD